MTITIYFGQLKIEDGQKVVDSQNNNFFELDSATTEKYFQSTENHKKLWFKLTKNFKCFPCIIKLNDKIVKLICNLKSTQNNFNQYDGELLDILDRTYKYIPNIYIETR